MRILTDPGSDRWTVAPRLPAAVDRGDASAGGWPPPSPFSSIPRPRGDSAETPRPRVWAASRGGVPWAAVGRWDRGRRSARRDNRRQEDRASPPGVFVAGAIPGTGRSPPPWCTPGYPDALGGAISTHGARLDAWGRVRRLQAPGNRKTSPAPPAKKSAEIASQSTPCVKKFSTVSLPFSWEDLPRLCTSFHEDAPSAARLSPNIAPQSSQRSQRSIRLHLPRPRLRAMMCR